MPWRLGTAVKAALLPGAAFTQSIERSFNVRAKLPATACSLSEGLAHIRFAKVAYGAKRLQVFKNGFSSLAPRDDVIDMKLNAGSERGTRAAPTTAEAVSLEYMPTKAKRRVAPCAPGRGYASRWNRRFSAYSVCETHKDFKSRCPRTEPAVVWGLGDNGRWRR